MICFHESIDHKRPPIFFLTAIKVIIATVRNWMKSVILYISALHALLVNRIQIQIKIKINRSKENATDRCHNQFSTFESHWQFVSANLHLTEFHLCQHICAWICFYFFLFIEMLISNFHSLYPFDTCALDYMFDGGFFDSK